MKPPQTSDYHEYFGPYIALVPQGDIFSILKQGLERTLAMLRDLPPGKADYRYAPGKWSIKDVIAHLVDSERTFAYRAFCFARGAAGPLPDFDADTYANAAQAGNRSIQELASELQALRRSTIALFRSFDEEMTDRRGESSGGFRFAVRAFPWIIAGHEIHHQRLIEQRYLQPADG